MTREEKQAALMSLFRELPEIMTPMQIARALHQSKNLIYEKLKEKKKNCRGISSTAGTS